jgi:glutaminase
MGWISPIEARLAALLERYADLDEGQVADYIPELARADPDQFAIVIATVDGQVYEVGDSQARFTIQSASKPFLFALALEDYGRDELLSRVGVEPTGDPFNAIVLDEAANRPPNPMVNAGAIAVTGLVGGPSRDDRWSRILSKLEACAGTSLAVDEAVAQSESETGHRNRAIAHLMRNFDMIRSDVDEVLDLYFRQCAVLVTAVDLAMMGATLAAGGRNPRTGKQVIGAEHVPLVLSVMSSCGMYDASGSWLYQVGLPAKSGVAGGVVAVLPGQVGIGVFSPRLDPTGNSLRGVRVCEDLSHELGMHLFADGARAGDAVRSVYRRDVRASRRVRSPGDEEVLHEFGQELLVVELQGRLVFGSIERLSRQLEGELAVVRHLIVDLSRVAGGDSASAILLAELLASCAATGVTVQVIASESPWTAAIAADLRWSAVIDVDRALEKTESAILATHGSPKHDAKVPLADVGICAGLDEDDLAALADAAPLASFAHGTALGRTGDSESAAFLILRGNVIIATGPSPTADRRLRVLPPGSCVGEMGLVSGAPRTAWMIAEGDVECHVLSAAGLDEFTSRRPHGAVQMMRNIAGLLGGWLRDAAPIEVDR